MTNQYKKITMPSGFVSTTPLPTKEELQKFYAETYYQAPVSSTYQESYDELELDYKRTKCKAMIHALRGLAPGSGQKFLDVGAGEGFLLNAAHESGFQVTGLDFSAFGVDKFFPLLSERHRAGDIFESLEQLAAEKQKFAVCTSTNVLEHVLDPDLFLKSIRNILDENGILAITVPNDYSDIQKLAIDEGMIDREFWFVPPHHLHFFNTRNILVFLKERGFDVLDAFSDFPVDLYLLHSASNYVMNPKSGRDANRSRMHHDLMIVRHYGLDKYLDYYRAMFKVGLGRDITIVVRPSKG